LHRRLDRELLAYVTAAGAASAGILSLAQPAKAEIVYTPANQTISPNQQFGIDVNGDGIQDFDIDNQFFPRGHHAPAGGNFPTNGSSSVGNLVAFPAPGDRVLGNGDHYAAALLPFMRVGPGVNWDPKDGRLESCASNGSGTLRNIGPWPNVKARYLGLSFSIEDHIHYGWARFTVTQNRCEITAVLTGYAYETIPGQPIVTGKTSGPEKASADERQPATLGLLAQGFTGLDAWRRGEDQD
jgi:hypothetical protein